MGVGVRVTTGSTTASRKKRRSVGLVCRPSDEWDRMGTAKPVTGLTRGPNHPKLAAPALTGEVVNLLVLSVQAGLVQALPLPSLGGGTVPAVSSYILKAASALVM